MREAIGIINKVGFFDLLNVCRPPNAHFFRHMIRIPFFLFRNLGPMNNDGKKIL